MIEKDAGEKAVIDFQSFYFDIKDFYNTRIIIGDYLCQFGQGLALWSPYGISKGASTVANISRNGRNIYPYSSTDENKYFRGMAAAGKFDKFILTAFYSSNSIDASIDSVTGNISAFPIDGYHRTLNEVNKKDNTMLQTFGTRIDYNLFDNSNIAALYTVANYNKAITNSGNKRKFDCFSLSYNSYFKKIYFTGETAFSNSSIATINNLTFQFTNDFSTVLSIRNYPTEYSFTFSNAFAEGSSTSNEFGIYTGFELKTGYGKFNAYIDQYKFPRAVFGDVFPSSGVEYSIYYSLKISKRLNMNLRYFNENKEVNEESGNTKLIFNRNIRKYRVEFITLLTNKIRLKSRIEYLTYTIDEQHEFEQGLLAYQDLYTNVIKGLQLYSRITFFTTDSYNSRLYAYENDLPGSLSNPALYGKGLKWYLLVKYKIIENMLLSLKYSELIKPNEYYLGSGNSLIVGNLDNRISLQLEFSY